MSQLFSGKQKAIIANLEKLDSLTQRQKTLDIQIENFLINQKALPNFYLPGRLSILKEEQRDIKSQVNRRRARHLLLISYNEN